MNRAVTQAVSALVIFAGGLVVGYGVTKARWDRSIAAQLQVDHSVLLVGLKDSFDIGVKLDAALEENRDITKRILEAADRADYSGCSVLPVDWSLLHNSAAGNTAPSGRHDGEASGRP